MSLIDLEIRPPEIINSSCSGDNIQIEEIMKGHPTPSDVIRVSVSLCFGIVVFVSNAIFLFAVNHSENVKYLPLQPRYLLSSWAITELLKGLIAAPLGVYPSLYYCWPYHPVLCGFQALLLPFLLQQAASSLIILAFDRYCCLFHPGYYRSYSSKSTTLSLIFASWLVTCLIYVVLFSSEEFFFSTSSGSCQVFPSRHTRVTVAACCIYFPSTMIIMYCYGTAFHIEGKTVHRLVGLTVTTPQLVVGTSLNAMAVSEKSRQIRVSRVMAVLSLAFIILITPWTIRQIIAACTDAKMPLWLDYGLWIINEVASLVMLLVYWLLSPSLRKATHHTLHTKKTCLGSTIYDNGEEIAVGSGIQSPSGPRRCSSLQKSSQMNGRLANRSTSSDCLKETVDPESAGEKLWGEILERAVSSTSLHHFQRSRTGDPSYGTPRDNPRQRPATTRDPGFGDIPTTSCDPGFSDIPMPKCSLHPFGIRPF